MILLFRLSHWLLVRRIPVLPRLLYAVNRVVFSIALPPSVKVGKDLLFDYSGLGIVIHAIAVKDCRDKVEINVTGGKCSRLNERPILKDGVEVDAGTCELMVARIGHEAWLSPLPTGRAASVSRTAV